MTNNLKRLNREFIYRNFIVSENIIDYYILANEELVIPMGVEKIEGFAFNKLANLRSVVLPSTLKHIGAFAFNHCISLEKIKCDSPNVKVSQSTFNHCPMLEEIDMTMQLDDNNDLSIIFGADNNYDFVCTPKTLQTFKIAKASNGASISKTYYKCENSENTEDVIIAHNKDNILTFKPIEID